MSLDTNPQTVDLCPWKGLSPYEAEDSVLFVGRERAIRQLGRAMEHSALAGVVGASGSGKSSLVLAGLAGNNARVISFRPGSSPNQRLHEALDYVHSDDERASTLVVDQLEEVFTQCDDEQERTTFLQSLCDLAGSGALRVVVALRSDYYGMCAPYLDFADALSASHVLLGALSEEEFRRIISEPANVCGFILEPGLEDEIIDDVQGEPGALPLLSHALSETWLRRSGNTLTIAGYRDAGGVRGAIARTAETAWRALPADQQEAARSVLVRLASPGSASLDTSRRVAISGLVVPGDVSAQHAFDKLISARIITVDGGAVEIAHEAVFREWPRLRGWLENDRRSLQSLRRLQDSALEWKASNQDSSALYRGTRLEAALELDRDRFELDDVAKSFVAASIDAQSQQQREVEERATKQRTANKRLRALLAGALALLLVATVAGAAALQQRNRANQERRVADARRVAAASISVRSDQLDLAALLAVESRRLSADASSDGALFAALTERPGLRGYLPHADTTIDVVVDGTGRFVANPGDDLTKPVELWDVSAKLPKLVRLLGIGGNDTYPYRLQFLPSGGLLVGDDSGAVSIIDPTTNKFVMKAAVPHDGSVWAVALSPNGKVVASGGDEGVIRIIDASTGKEIRDPLNGDGATIQTTEFSPDGKILATGGDAGLLRFWDTTTWKELGEPTAIDGGVWSLGWSPDGRTIAVGSDVSLHFYDAATRLEVGTPIGAHDGIIYRTRFLNGGREVVSSGEDGRVMFWYSETHQPSRPGFAGHNAGVRVALNEQANRLATASDDGRVGIWDLRGENLVATPLATPNNAVVTLAATPDGTLVGVDPTGNLLRWGSNGNPSQSAISLGELDLTSVAVADDGSRVAIGAADGSVRVVDPNGKLLAPILQAGKRSDAVALSPDGQVVAIANLGSDCEACVQLFDVDKADRPKFSLRSPGLAKGRKSPATAVAFDRTGSMLATGIRRGWVDLWDPATGRHRWGTRLDRGIRSLAFTPDGRILAVGANTGLLMLFDTTNGKLIRRLQGHRGEVIGLAFRPDGSMLASTSVGDHTLRVWRMDNGLTFGGPVSIGVDETSAPAWVDNTRIAAPHSTTGVMLYDIDAERLGTNACELAHRNLTQDEWQQYLPKGEPYRRTCPRFEVGK
jgi:WD40 repeat protein/CHASE3 domain sensor protein